MDGKRGRISVMVVVLSFCVANFVDSVCNKKAVIFNFGDSNSDTGGFYAATGLKFGLPNSRSLLYQHLQSGPGRQSDGRLIIDFLCESVGMGYLRPYLDSLDSNFSNGANFAVSGSKTLPKLTPCNLDVQILQFLRFRDRSLHLRSKGHKGVPKKQDFRDALYSIDIGQNDIVGAFFSLPYAQVLAKIPYFITEIKNAIWTIYQKGGKNFWVHNTGPLGCSPASLATAGHYAHELDHYGCVEPFNNAAKLFNHQLSELCDHLRSQLKNAVIVYVDLYAIKYNLIANYANYGFENPLMGCCGYGGPPYNYSPNVTCGIQEGFNVCAQELRYISWDGIHYTEAANTIFASKILSTRYSTPQINFNFFCNPIIIKPTPTTLENATNVSNLSHIEALH